MNRVLADRITTWAFAPTELAKENLLREGTPEEMIHVTGNTVIDALFYTVKSTARPSRGDLAGLPENAPFLLVTAHRRESWGKPLEDICTALTMLLDAHPELWMVVPMHKNPSVRETIRKYLENRDKVILCDPLDYPDFVWAMNASKFILRASGGVQEEASAIKKPVLILRDVTERPEAVENGSGILVGVNTENIFSNAVELLENETKLAEIEKSADHSLRDGTAAVKIADALKDYFDKQGRLIFVVWTGVTLVVG